MDNLINILFPPKCAFCGKVGELFCTDCLSQCVILNGQICIVCNKPSPDGYTHKWCQTGSNPTQSISSFIYSGLVRECIKKSKYHSKQFMALKILAHEAVSLVKDWGFTFENFICTSVPISKIRYFERGFNQVDLIARKFADTFCIDFDNSILKRTRDTKAQHEIGKVERAKNVFGAFTCNPEKVKGRRIVVIDDIATTGSTLLEISKVLYLAGVKEVRCFTLSKRL
jgi:competence protein ComFC